MRNNLYGQEARNTLLAGAEMLSKVVGSSMGPQGRNTVFDAALNYPTYPTSSRDGVTIARQFSLESAEASGIKMIKEAAERTVKEAGDGTSTTVVLAYNIFRIGLSDLAKGKKLTQIRAEITQDTKVLCDEIDKASLPLSGDMLRQVAVISSNNDAELGRLIASATKQAGPHGIVAVEESLGSECSIERIEGMSLDQGFISAVFVNNELRQSCELINPVIMMLDRPLTSMQGLAPIMNTVASGGHPLLILAEDVRGEALATLAMNKMQGRLSVCAVKLPTNLGHRKDLLLDIQALCGGTAVLQELGMDVSKFTSKDLGSAEKAVITSSNLRISGGRGTGAQQRREHIQGLLAQNPTDLEREKLNERLAKLTGGLTVLRLSARSGLEMGELKARCEDGCLATRCALEEGVVEGGGMALIRAAWKSWNSQSIVQRAAQYPALEILHNAGLSGPINKIAVNAMTGQPADLLAEGVIDPAKVVKAALRNAASVASVMLATEVLVQITKE